MSKKNNSSNNNKDCASNVSPDSVDALIHGNRAGSSVDKARGKETTTGSERVQGSNQKTPLTSSKSNTTEVTPAASVDPLRCASVSSCASDADSNP